MTRKLKCWPPWVLVQHWATLYGADPLERLDSEIRHCSDVGGIFPNEAAVTRLVGALLLGQNDGWVARRARSMTLETIAPLGDDLAGRMPALAA